MLFKKNVGIGLSVLLALTMSACGTGTGSNANPDSTDSEQEQVTLRFAWWGGQARQELYDKIVADFEEKHPHIKIEQEFSDFDPYWQRLATQAAGGNTPDVLSMHLTRYMDYANRKQLLPLDDLIESKAIDMSDFDSNIIDIGKVNGENIMVSIGNSSKGFFYNADLFEEHSIEPPSFDVSWDEFSQIAAKVKEAVGQDNFYFIDDQSGITDTFGYFLRQRGKDLYTDDGMLGFTKEDMIEYQQYWDELRRDGLVPPAALTAEYKGRSHQESMIAKGITASVIAPGNQMKLYQMYMEDELNIVRLPSDPEGEAGEDIGGVFLSISSKTQHPEEAAEFINYWINDVDAGKMFKDEMGIIQNQRISEIIHPLRVPADVKVADYQQRITPYVNVPITPPAGNADVIRLFSLASEAIAFGQQTIEQAVDDFFAESAKVLK